MLADKAGAAGQGVPSTSKSHRENAPSPVTGLEAQSPPAPSVKLTLKS